MICNDCGHKHGTPSNSVSTYQKTNCDWCNTEQYCTQEYKFGITKETTNE